jgi:hypothetical protein
LSHKDTATPKSYKKAFIVEGTPVFSTIKYYFGLIQHKKAKKSKQLFKYIPDIITNQNNTKQVINIMLQLQQCKLFKIKFH